MQSFTEGLWGHGPGIFDVQSRRLKTLDALVAFFKEKSALDRYYCRSLRKLAKLHLVENETPSSPLQGFLHGFRDLLETISTNYEILAAKEANQMLNPLNRAKAKLQADNKTLRRESEKFGSHLSKLQAIHKRTRHEARMLCREAVQARRKCDTFVRVEKNASAKMEHQRRKLKEMGLADPTRKAQHAAVTHKLQKLKFQGQALAERSRQLKKEFDAADNKYIAAVKSCREFRGKHDSAACTVLRGLEKTEGQRILAVKEGVRRYLMVESEMTKKLLMSYQSVLAMAEIVEVPDELKSYVQHFRTGKTLKPLPEYYHFPSHEDVIFRDKFDPNDYAKSAHKKKNSDVTSIAQGKLFPEIQRIVGTALAKGGIDEPRRKQLDGILETKDGRSDFAAVLNDFRNHGFDEKLAHGMELKPQVFTTLAALMNQFLDHAEKTMDTGPAQLVMVISQTFYQREGSDKGEAKDQKGQTGQPTKNEKIFLQSLVKKHTIWKSSRFWEEAFFGSLTRALLQDSKVSTARWHTDSEQAEALDRQKKVLFGQLGAYAHNMLGFGMSKAATLQFVRKICNINEMGEQESRMLQEAVHAAATGMKNPNQDTSDPNLNPKLESGNSSKYAHTKREKQVKMSAKEMHLGEECFSPISHTTIPTNERVGGLAQATSTSQQRGGRIAGKRAVNGSTGTLAPPVSAKELSILESKDEVVSIATASTGSKDPSDWTPVTHSDFESNDLDELP